MTGICSFILTTQRIRVPVMLVNAFDLVRLHMYGDKDRDAKDGTPVNKLPSFVAMSHLAVGR